MAAALRIITVIVALSACCAASRAADPPATRPQSPAKTLEQFKKENQETFAAQWRGLPTLAPMPVAQVLHFGVDHDRLILDSQAPTSSGVWYAIDLTDISAKAMFQITAKHGASPPANFGEGVKFISFNTWDFSDPALIDRHLQVLGGPTNLQVVYDIEYLDRDGVQWSQEVSLMQKSDPAAPDQVTLRMETSPDSGPGVPTTIPPIIAPSFTALRTEHPLEFEQYVRPTFRALRQDPAVLGVDSRMAWQVLGDTVKPPADVAAKVSSVLAQLNADDFATRAAAAKQLDSLGEPAALYLMSADRSALTPEQKARCEKFLAGYRPLTEPQVRAFRENVNFLLDCLYSDDPALRSAALQHLGKAVGHDVQFDLDAPPPQRVSAIAALRQRLASGGGANR
jgi:hypothetical protein